MKIRISNVIYSRVVEALTLAGRDYILLRTQRVDQAEISRLSQTLELTYTILGIFHEIARNCLIQINFRDRVVIQFSSPVPNLTNTREMFQVIMKTKPCHLVMICLNHLGESNQINEHQVDSHQIE